MDKYILYYQILDQAESFNCGEPLIENHGCDSMEEVDKDIERLLELWPWCGYFVIEHLVSRDPIKSKPFDYEQFYKEYYEKSID